VGSGVIGIPYALHRAGFGLGLALLILVAYITDYSLILMVSGGPQPDALPQIGFKWQSGRAGLATKVTCKTHFPSIPGIAFFA